MHARLDPLRLQTHADRVVVAMQSLSKALVRDKVCRVELEVGLGHVHGVCFQIGGEVLQ
jgi:hypothetical protein